LVASPDRYGADVGTLSTHVRRGRSGGAVFGLGASQLAAVAAGATLVLVLLTWVVRREPDPVIGRIILVGFVAKLAGTAAYYRVIADVYGFGDVTHYVSVGRELAPIIRSGTMPDQAQATGTAFTEFLTGLVFAIFGSSELVGYFVFSLLSFVGMVAFLKALQLAVPGANHRRYALILLLMPTMVYWPSTIGKDAWLVLTLGIATYGGARILRGARFAYPLIGLGLLGMAAVRPHMALLFTLSFAAAYLLWLGRSDVRRGASAWLVGLVAVLGGVMFAATNFSEEMGSGSQEQRITVSQVRTDAEGVIDATDRTTRLGGSQFEARPVAGPVGFVYAVLTLPFRPFPHEANNFQAMFASLEGLFLLLLVLFSARRLVRLPSAVFQTPFFAFCAVYTAGFLVAFSNFSNLGLLSRQRSQLLPFLLVLLVIPLAEEVRERTQPPGPRRRRATRGPVLEYVKPDVSPDPSGIPMER
jgi:hypothetical protein